LQREPAPFVTVMEIFSVIRERLQLRPLARAHRAAALLRRLAMRLQSEWESSFISCVRYVSLLWKDAAWLQFLIYGIISELFGFW